MAHFTVNVHDIFECGLLRLVSPQELVEGLRLALPSRRVDVIDWGSEEGRVDFCVLNIDGFKVRYQVCGLFSGDEYFEFQEDAPKRLVDEVLAVWERLAADALSEHLRTGSAIEVGGAKVKILTPEEALVEGDERRRAEYLAKKEAAIARACREASGVLAGRKSFFDRKLKGYKRRKTLGEVMAEMAELAERIDRAVEEELEGEPEPLRFLVKEYLEWRLRLTGFEEMFETFQEKVESRHKALSTLPERGWGPLDAEQKRQLDYFKAAIEDKELLRRAVREGKRLLPKLKG